MAHDRLLQSLDALATLGREVHVLRARALQEQVQGGLVGGLIDLVEDQDLGCGDGGELGEDGSHGLHLTMGLGVGGVDHVQQKISLERLLQGRVKRRYQVVRQVTHETDRIGEQQGAAVREFPGSRACVERGEGHVGHEDVRPRETVHQGRFAGVGVAPPIPP